MRSWAAFTLSVSMFVAAPALGATVAYWEFEEGPADAAASGAGSILDSANGLDGTPIGTDGPVYRSVPISGGSLGLEFDGVDDRIYIPDDPLLALTQSLTVEAIVKVDAIDTGVCDINQIVVRADDRAGLDPYFLAVGEHFGIEDICFVIWDSEEIEESVAVGTPVTLGQWFHVAGTLDDATGKLRLYINGEMVDEKTTDVRPLGPLTGTNPGIGIGNLQCDWLDQYFDGTIAAVRISDEALSPNEFLSAPPIPAPGALLLGILGVGVAGLCSRFRRRGRGRSET